MDENFGKGWLIEYPNLRDYTIDTDKVSEKVGKIGRSLVIIFVSFLFYSVKIPLELSIKKRDIHKYFGLT